MRHRRHIPLASARPRRLRATAAAPCAAAMLTALLTGAAPGSGAHEPGHGKAAAVTAEDDARAKSPRVHGTSQPVAHVRPSPPAPSAPGTADAAEETAERTEAAEGAHGADADRTGKPERQRSTRGSGPGGEDFSGGVAAQPGDDEAGLFGDQDLYEPAVPEPAPHGRESTPPPGRAPTTAATGEVSPVLPLGAGMTLIGLGLALIALRLRHT